MIYLFIKKIQSITILVALLLLLFNHLWVQDPAAMVIDHTSYAVSETEGDHTLIASDDFIKSNVLLGSEKVEVIAGSDSQSWLFSLCNTTMYMLSTLVFDSYLWSLHIFQ